MRAPVLLVAIAAISCSHPARSAHQDQVPDEVVPDEPGAPTPPVLRLPDDVRPTRQALTLTIDPTKPTFTGVALIDAEVVRPTRVVWLNARGLTVTGARVAGAAAEVIAGGEDFVGLIAAEQLPVGEVTLSLEYEAPIDHERSQGVYAEEEGSASYAYTFFEPVDARRAFPCFDEPAYKIPWKLTFVVAPEHVALGNAAVVNETVTDLTRTVELEWSKPLPSYLVAFVVGPFEIIDGGTGGRVATPIRFLVPKGRSAELRYAKEVTPKVVAALEDYFDMDYPYGKLDVAVVPRYWGTMEHPGIVAMGQPLTLIPPDQETRQRKQAYANILAHELAHYWFGDYVTMAWWDDTWLNEALAQWLDMAITDAVEPKWAYPEERLGMAAWGMSADELTVARAMRQPVDSLEGIAASFDNGITYAKGSQVLRMFEAWIGAGEWRGFIRAYVRKYAWGNATADDFIGTLADELGPAASDAFVTFLEQPGVPLISHEVDCKGATPRLVLHQRRSLPAGSVDDGAHLWKLPVCVRWHAGKKSAEACTLLDAVDGDLPLPVCPTAVMMNREAMGYYRAAYSVDEAKALLARPKKKAKAWLSSAERRSVVQDIQASVDRAEIEVGEALALVATLAADADDRVAGAGIGLAGLIQRRALDDALYAKDRKFVVKALGPLARRLGWKRGAKDSDDRHQLRLAIVPWVAEAGDPKLAAEAAKLARKWIADRKSVPDDVGGAVLGVAVAGGDAALFDDVLAAARATTERRDKSRLLGALGGFHDPALATRALGLVTSGEFDLRDAQGIVFSLLYTRETQELTWTWIKDSLDGLLSLMRDDEAGGALAGVTGAFCDTAHRDEAKALFEPRAAKIAGADSMLAQALEGVDQCIAQHARNLPGVEKFLDAY